ncbi:FixH family protein [Paenibacillus guangzhouensis]|uniref:FixH family protein n=1 Tax=Paenibacillus guangzhouensis TaxID=1473112 RepID=UPI00187BC3E3|nr:FixH family protein [Paenibacillus guangzhouensis]
MQRKKMSMLAIACILLIALLAGCSGSNEGMNHDGMNMDMDMSEDAMNPIKVEIILPAQITANKDVVLQAKVTQTDKPVDDAKEVMFELWRGEEQEHEKIEAKLTSNGVYQIEKQFAESGEYTMIAHVTAREMHSMPKKTFEVAK